MVTKGSSYVVELVHGFHQESPKVIELEVGFHHGCSGSDHRSPRVVKLVMGLHHGSPMMVKLEVGLHHLDVTLGSIRCPEVVKPYKRCKKVKFMMEFHYGSLKEREASVGASP